MYHQAAVRITSDLILQIQDDEEEEEWLDLGRLIKCGHKSSVTIDREKMHVLWVEVEFEEQASSSGDTTITKVETYGFAVHCFWDRRSKMEHGPMEGMQKVLAQMTPKELTTTVYSNACGKTTL